MNSEEARAREVLASSRNDPIKHRARRQVRTAIERGHLVKPGRCDECDRDPGAGRDGRSLLHAHHHRGYAHPLDVEWLCAGCHAAHDPRASGERNGQSKLTAAAVAEIKNSHAPAEQLARRLGVSGRTIRYVRAGTYWSKDTQNAA